MAGAIKNLNLEISYECWKRLKIISVDKDMRLHDVARDILEKGVKLKKVDTFIEEKSN